MLSFSSQATFQYVYECLEEAYEAHLDEFEAQWGNLSEDDYNDMADQLSFIDEQPLIEFESALGLNSFRSWYASALDTWLDGGEDPEAFSTVNRFNDVVMSTLYNYEGAVMIGGIVHLVDKNGVSWQFCSCSKYQEYLQDPAAFGNNEDPCVVVPKAIFEGNGLTCRNHEKNCFWTSITEQRKVQQTLSFYYGSPASPGYTTATSEIIAYKWKFGKWRLRRMPLKVLVSGMMRTDECVEKGPTTRDKGFKTRRRLSVNHGFPELRTFIDGEVRGQYWYTINALTDTRYLYSWYNGCY